MRKITNTQEANTYYEQINKYVDEYIGKWKVRPSEIRYFFKNNLKSFLENVGLSDVEGIDKVVRDVLDHRYHMELDKVMKFENFISESVVNIGKSNLSHDKFVADYYDTSMGHVECVDEDMHIFRVSETGKRINCIVFSHEEINSITDKVVSAIKEETMNKWVSVTYVEGIKLEMPIKLGVSNIWNEDSFEKELRSKLEKSSVIYLIKSLIGKGKSEFSAERITFKGDSKGFSLWEIDSNETENLEHHDNKLT